MLQSDSGLNLIQRKNNFRYIAHPKQDMNQDYKELMEKSLKNSTYFDHQEKSLKEASRQIKKVTIQRII